LVLGGEFSEELLEVLDGNNSSNPSGVWDGVPINLKCLPQACQLSLIGKAGGRNGLELVQEVASDGRFLYSDGRGGGIDGLEWLDSGREWRGGGFTGW